MSTYLSVDKSFERAIARGAGHFRSAELDTAVRTIAAFIKSKNAQTITAVRNALGNWRDRNPKEYADRGQPIESDLRTELHAQLDFFKVPKAAPSTATVSSAPVNANAAWSLKDVTVWIQALRADLERLGSYACGDLLHGQPKIDRYGKPVTYDPHKGPDWTQGFARVANPSQHTQVLQRYNDKKNYPGSTNEMLTPMLIGRGWKAGVCKGFFDAVSTGKRGVCTSFGQAAGHVLTHGRQHGPRVELVSWGGNRVGHVYVLVNRSGGYVGQGNAVPDDWVSQPQLVVVDAWLGSLGWPVIYIGGPNYRSSMRTGLLCTGEKPAW